MEYKVISTIPSLNISRDKGKLDIASQKIGIHTGEVKATKEYNQRHQ